MKKLQEGLMVAAGIIVMLVVLYVAVVKNFNKAGVMSYSVVVHLSDHDRKILSEIRDNLKVKTP